MPFRDIFPLQNGFIIVRDEKKDVTCLAQRQRRLAAIMFTDMVGYTALGQRNESLSLALVEEQRKLIRPILNKHNGREVKTMGDAFLVEFPSALDGVRCAYDIQRATREFNISLPQEQRVHLRIGVHLGDVVESQGDISGDAVNVASRIESLAEDGGVCLTRQVHDSIRNKFQLPLANLGTKSLKNVDMPVEVYRMVMPWETSEVQEELPLESSTHRLAVLPFTNMSPDPNDEFFADGLTEEMIAELSGVSGVGVIARTSVMHYKGSKKTVREIARDLGVGSVLEGSIRKAGNRIRITAQLIDGKNEEHLWAQRFDRDLNDIFAVQSEIAGSVAKALELKLVPRDAPTKPASENLDVYTICLKARYFWNRRSKEGIEQAISLFEEALKLAPDSARTNAGLADCYLIATDYGFMDEAEGASKTKEFTARALELDRTLPDAHATLGMVLMRQKQYSDAEVELNRAISLNPNYASAHHWYFILLAEVGRLNEGLTEILKAAELDPLSPIINLALSWAYFYAGRLDDSMSTVNKLIQIEPGLPFAYGGRSCLYAMKGLRDEAVADLAMFYKLTRDESGYKVQSAFCEALLGNKEDSLTLIREAMPLIEKDHNLQKNIPRLPLYWVYATIGDKEQFFKWVDWAIERKLTNAMDLRYNPALKEMREDSRYLELFKKFNLSQ